MTFAGTCESLDFESTSGVVGPPWETTPSGVVSLFAMLDFAARPFLDLCHRFGLCLGQGKPPDPNVVRDLWADLLKETVRLDLPVTREGIICLFEEIAKSNPTKVKFDSEGWEISGAGIPSDRMAHHVESIYKTLRAELGSVLLKAIPKEKAKYCDPKWLFETPLYVNFPTAWREFQSAGRCFAYGENTACAFHLQRALEWGLKSLAVHLGKRFDRNCWEKHIEDIERELKSRYGAAGPRTPAEKFYSEAAAQFGNVKVAWRNPTMHIEAQYDEREGAYLLTTVEQFMTHLAKNNLKEEHEKSGV